MIKDKIILYNQRDFLNIPCASCGKTKHQINKCPLINYVPNKSIVIHAYKQMNYQPRKTKTRSDRKKINALRQLDKLMNVSKLIEIKYPEFTEIFSDEEEESSKRQSMEFSKRMVNLEKKESLEYHQHVVNSEKLISNNEIVKFPKEKNIYVEIPSIVMDANNNKIASKTLDFKSKHSMIKESPMKISDDLINFENARNYKHYFPKNNITEIIRLNSLNRQIILSPKYKPSSKKKFSKMSIIKHHSPVIN